jgi:hypothetical protein
MLGEEHACKPKDVPISPGTVLGKEDESGTLPEENEYNSIVGSLLYLAMHTRPDISFAVGTLSRFMSAPTHRHMQAAKHVLRYLRGTIEKGLFFEYGPAGECEPYSQGSHAWWRGATWKNQNFLHNDSIHNGTFPANWEDASWFPNIPRPEVFCDADYGGEVASRKSTTGFFIAWVNHTIIWFSKLQLIVTTSTTEAEFVAAATATKEDCG